MGRILWCFLGVAVAGCLVFMAVKGYQLCFPYGFHHSSSDALSLWLAFQAYADDHDGRFPDGEGTPEVSLCSLYPQYANAYMLRGRHVTDLQAKSILDSEKTLVSSQCRWHYVPGLTLNDNPGLALAWEEEPRLDGSRAVVLVKLQSLDRLTISAPEWPAFLAEQARLLAGRDEVARQAIPLLAAKVRLPSGQVVDRYDAPYTLSHVIKALPEANHDGRMDTSFVGGKGSESSGSLLPRTLRHYRYGNLLQNEGSYTLTLSLGKMTSNAVTVEFRNGQCTPNSILFEMKNTKP